jgi:glycosyltransferase involved in cell wall biosynthesis
MSKKVIFIGPAFPYKGGIAAFNESMATTFQENGWDCKIYTFSDQYAVTTKDKLTTEDPRPNLTIRRGIYSFNPLNWLKISKEIVDERPELIVTQYWMPYLAPAFGTIFRGVKKELPQVKIATIVHSFKPHQSKIGDKQLNKFLANRSDSLICLSAAVEEEILGSGTQQPVTQLFHPIYSHYGEAIDPSVAKRKLGWTEDKKHFLFFGEVKRYKGLDLLLASLPVEKGYENKFELHIAGEFIESKKKYFRQIVKLGLKEYVDIRNEYIPNEVVPDLFCAADAIVTPYKNRTQSGIIPIALHFERPIIATTAGDLSNDIQHYQLGLVSGPDVKELNKNLKNFIDDKCPISSDYSVIKENISWQSFYRAFNQALNPPL